MNDFVQIIAETEGVRTPTTKRTRKQLADAFESFKEKKAAKKKAGVSSPHVSKGKQTTPKPAAAKDADASKSRPAPTYAEPIPLNFISPTGYVRKAGYDPKTKLFYVAFGKSTWAMPSNDDEWATFEKAVADPLTDIDAHYRKAFRGRTPDMIAVKHQEAK